MKKLSIYIVILISGFLYGSCDVMEGSYLEDPEIIDPGDDKIPLNLLVLEFTGHTCKSCPKAHRTIDQLVEFFTDRVVPVAIHTGFFARPQSGDKFTTDFRTPEGAELETYFEFTFFPIGLVGNLDKSRLSSYSSWPSEAASLIEKAADVCMGMLPEYDNTSGELEIKVNIMNKSLLEGDIRLAMYLVEDGVISWQKDEDQDPVDVEYYEHNHVFRTSAGSVWGEGLSESECSANANAQIARTIVMDPAWSPENCSVVAFLYETLSREVIQCISKKIIE